MWPEDWLNEALPIVYYSLCALCRSEHDANDALQQGVLNLLKHRDRYDFKTREDFIRCLRVVCKRVFWDVSSRRQREQEALKALELIPPGLFPAPGDPGEEAQYEGLVVQALESLEPDDLRMLEAKHGFVLSEQRLLPVGKPLTYEELAVALGLREPLGDDTRQTPGGQTAGRRYRRALERFRELLLALAS